MEKNNRKIALLIDCDNVSHNSIEGVLEELAKYGTVNVRHAHGDWNNPSLSGWADKLHPHAIRLATPSIAMGSPSSVNLVHFTSNKSTLPIATTGKLPQNCIPNLTSTSTLKSSTASLRFLPNWMP